MLISRQQEFQDLVDLALRKSGARRLRHHQHDILLVLAEGLRVHGFDAAAVSRRCLISTKSGGNSGSSPEDIKALSVDGEVFNLAMTQGWDNIVEEFCTTGRRGEFYKHYTRQVRWLDGPKPLSPGVMFHELRGKMIPVFHAAASQVQAKTLDEQVSPARASRPARRF